MVLTALITAVAPAAAGGELANGLECSDSYNCESRSCISGVCQGH